MTPPYTVLEGRVTHLEDLMAELTMNVNQLSRETRQFERETRQFQQEMRQFKNEMQEFKDEMQEFKEEMRDYKAESRAMSIDMNRKWGELSNKMGTMAEDLVAPSVGRILRETIGCPEDRIEWSGVRMRRRHSATGAMREFDVVAGCGDYLLVNETKSRLRPEDCEEFVGLLQEVRSYFPEYANKQVIGALASLYVDESLARRGERLGLIVLGFGDDVMQVLNSDGFIPRSF